MLISITNTRTPATDLGYLLHKNPGREHVRNLPFGSAHVYYPEANDERCTAVLLLEIDPVGLVRGKASSQEGGLLDQYVNDRPYVASSFLSVAIGQMFSTTLSGRCKDKPELADTPLPLCAEIAALPCRGGEALLRSLFEPLGYQVAAERLPLDPVFPEWGESNYFRVSLSGEVRLRDLLTHLYVLIPVLDADKHYWVGEDEVEKLLRKGKGWLESHPEKEAIADRYLKRRRRLTKMALAQLVEAPPELLEETEIQQNLEEVETERTVRLNDLRLDAVLTALKASGATRVLDMGCGEGRLLKRLLDDKQFTEIVGFDVSARALEMAKGRLHLDTMHEIKRSRIKLMQSSLTYWDERMKGFEAACAVEVIEHLDPHRLVAFERNVFGGAQPATVVITTPNIEFNVRFETLATGKLRHRDHRFEWTRAEFQQWANRIAEQYAYRVRFEGIGPQDAEVGAPTQMAVFER